MTEKPETKIKGGIHSLGDALDGEYCSDCGREFTRDDIVGIGTTLGRKLEGKPLPMPFLGMTCPACGHNLCIEMIYCSTVPLAAMVMTVHQQMWASAKAAKA